MIFVTVGTQLAFDRLIQAVEQWAAGSNEEVVAQIGPSELKPNNLRWHQFLTPSEFSVYMEQAKVIIAHAGMGSILTAMQLQKPIVILPRKAELHEHRNDHQIATARRFLDIDGIHVAMDEKELLDILQNLGSISAGCSVGPYASDSLINSVRAFIESPL